MTEGSITAVNRQRFRPYFDPLIPRPLSRYPANKVSFIANIMENTRYGLVVVEVGKGLGFSLRLGRRMMVMMVMRSQRRKVEGKSAPQ